MGIELRRRLVDAGLESVRVVAVALAETFIDPDEIDELRRQGSKLAERGELELARAQSAIDYVVEANEAGRYMGLALIFIAAGVVPEAMPGAEATS